MQASLEKNLGWNLLPYRTWITSTKLWSVNVPVIAPGYAHHSNIYISLGAQMKWPHSDLWSFHVQYLAAAPKDPALKSEAFGDGFHMLCLPSVKNCRFDSSFGDLRFFFIKWCECLPQAFSMLHTGLFFSSVKKRCKIPYSVKIELHLR